MKRIRQFLSILTWTLLVAGGTARADKPQRLTDGQGQGKPIICGGIAGLPCPQGKTCFGTDAHPDAMGVCLSAAQVEAGRNRCDAVRCSALECPAGQQILVTPDSCCGSCTTAPKARSLGAGATGAGVNDRCQNAAECDARDLPHIQCVGDWNCEQGRCKFTCDSGAAPPQY